MRSILNDFCRANCPLCSSSSVRGIGRIFYNQPVLFSSIDVHLEKDPELWRCTDCQSAFVQNVLQEDMARQLYSQGDSVSRWSTLAFEHHKPHEVVAELSRIFKNGMQHLDVGCSGGNLLDFSRKKGCLTTGIDYSSTTREYLECKGHAWFPSLEALEAREFDVITAFDLIEHLYEVGVFLQECCRRLRPGGRLVILTGDIDSRSARIACENWWYVAYPEHIVFPSRLIFESLSNFKLENWVPTYAAAAYNYPFYRVLLSHLKRMAMLKKYNGLPSRFPDHALIVLAKVGV